MRRSDPQGFDILAGQTIFGLKVEKRPTQQLPESGEPDVLANGHGCYQALALPILRYVGNTQRHRVFRAMNSHLSIVDLYCAGFRRSHAENSLGQLRTPGANQTSQPDDFAFANLNAGVP